MIAVMRLCFMPTQAPMGSILLSFAKSATLDRLAWVMRATALISTRSSPISGTSFLMTSVRNLGSVLERVSPEPFPFSASSRMSRRRPEMWSPTRKSAVSRGRSWLAGRTASVPKDLGMPGRAGMPRPISTMRRSWFLRFTMPETMWPTIGRYFSMTSMRSASRIFCCRNCLVACTVMRSSDLISTSSSMYSPGFMSGFSSLAASSVTCMVGCARGPSSSTTSQRR